MVINILWVVGGIVLLAVWVWLYTPVFRAYSRELPESNSRPGASTRAAGPAPTSGGYRADPYPLFGMHVCSLHIFKATIVQKGHSRTEWPSFYRFRLQFNFIVTMRSVEKMWVAISRKMATNTIRGKLFLIYTMQLLRRCCESRLC